MTQPPDDGAASLSRAERRRARSRSGRARRQAAGPETPPGERVEPAPAPPPAPAAVEPDLASSGTVEPSVAGPSRRERRQAKGRRRTRGADRDAVIESRPAPEPEPEPEPEPVPEPEPEPEPDPVPEPAPEPEPEPVARRRRARPEPGPRRKHAPRAKPEPAKPERAPRPAPAVSSRTLWRRVVPAIALCLAAAVGIGVVVRSVAESDDGARSTATGPGHAGPGAPVLLVHHGPLGNNLIVVAGKDQGQGAALLLPVATQLDVPSRGVSTLRDVPVDDGGVRLATSIQNVLGVEVGATIVLDDAALTSLLGPAAPVPVTLPDEVELPGRTAQYRAGAQTVSAAQASELLGTPQAGNEIDRLVTVAAVLDGWMDRLRDPRAAEETLAAVPGGAPLVAAAQAEEQRIDTLPVESIATGGGERYDVKEADLTAFVNRAFPTYRLGVAGRRPRVEILNGTGALGVAQAVSEKIVPAGGRVRLTNNFPGFGVTETQVVYFRDEWRKGAQALLAAMGCGSLRKAGKDIGIADVTILVGSDCPAYGAPGGGT